jgi:diketogulonate reductase-like aldo/keto reductase
MNSLTDTYSLTNGVKIPCIGFGTWQIPDGDTVTMAVKTAIECGYRHIDTAAVYANEVGVGRGIKESGINRKDIFVTSKVWNTDRGFDKTLIAFEKTMNDLKLDYLDLYLIHWPASFSQFKDYEKINLETWRALIKLYKEGKVRAIGISNFMPHHLTPLMKTEIPPMVNQIEFHPGQMQSDTVRFCKENNILIEAWSPLGTGKLLSNPILEQIASKYQKSIAQLCIRWCLQNGVLPLPKAVTPVHIEENSRVFDFAISDEDMNTINRMDYCGGSGLHPDEIDF